MHGLLVVNKPAGMISKDVSRWLVKRIGKVKLGHVGTLDPGASGVLPLLLGRATRLQDYLLELPKSYEFDVEFGRETDTLDNDGQNVKELPWEHVTEDSLRESIKAFVGELEQTPPLYSAVKYKGRPLYDYARAQEGDDLPLEAMKRIVTVSRFDFLTFGGKTASFRVTCSKGTYVRTLVKDLAEKVGTCGTLTRLVRTRAAGCELQAAHDLEALEAKLNSLDDLVVPVERIDLGMPRWCAVQKPAADKLRSGQTIQLEFAEFSEGADEGLTPVGWSKPVVLLDETKKAYGIGTVRRLESGRVLVTMKRGL